MKKICFILLSLLLLLLSGCNSKIKPEEAITLFNKIKPMESCKENNNPTTIRVYGLASDELSGFCIPGSRYNLLMSFLSSLQADFFQYGLSMEKIDSPVKLTNPKKYGMYIDQINSPVYLTNTSKLRDPDRMNFLSGMLEIAAKEENKPSTYIIINSCPDNPPPKVRSTLIESYKKFISQGYYISIFILKTQFNGTRYSISKAQAFQPPKIKFSGNRAISIMILSREAQFAQNFYAKLMSREAFKNFVSFYQVSGKAESLIFTKKQLSLSSNLVFTESALLEKGIISVSKIDLEPAYITFPDKFKQVVIEGLDLENSSLIENDKVALYGNNCIKILSGSAQTQMYRIRVQEEIPENIILDSTLDDSIEPQKILYLRENLELILEEHDFFTKYFYILIN